MSRECLTCRQSLGWRCECDGPVSFFTTPAPLAVRQESPGFRDEIDDMVPVEPICTACGADKDAAGKCVADCLAPMFATPHSVVEETERLLQAVNADPDIQVLRAAIIKNCKCTSAPCEALAALQRLEASGRHRGDLARLRAEVERGQR